MKCKNDLVEKANAQEEVKASSKEESEEEKIIYLMNLDDQIHQTTLFVCNEPNNKNAVIIDTGSTTHLKGGSHLLKNFRWDKKDVRIKCSKGVVATHWMADYEFFPVNMQFHVAFCGKKKIQSDI